MRSLLGGQGWQHRPAVEAQLNLNPAAQLQMLCFVMIA